LNAYAQTHKHDEIKIDFFAVSLPDLVIFDDDLNKRNKIHCMYMQGLACIGLQQSMNAKECFKTVLDLDPSHQGALIHLMLLNKNFTLLLSSAEVEQRKVV
jgi:hypothetical protein